MLYKPHHVNYVVSDLDRSIWFYREVLGLKLIQDAIREHLPAYDTLMGASGVKLRVALFEMPNTHLLLELFQFFHPAPIQQEVGYRCIGSSHVAFEASDLEAVYKKLVEQGCKTISPPTNIIRDGKLLARGMYAIDPDGIIIEMFEPNSLGRETIPGFKKPVSNQ